MHKIVALDKRHIADIAEIERASFKTPWSHAMLMNELKNPLATYFVVENEGKPLAYIGFYRILDEAHITNIAVRPDVRGQGIANSLLKYALDKIKELKIKRVTLEVNEKNTAAIALYEKFGFTEEGRRPKYYEGEDDALIYWLKTGE